MADYLAEVMEEYFIVDEQEMIALGQRIGSEIPADGCIGLVGDLGAGKTHFTKGVCRAVGASDTTSPTFTIVNEVIGDSGKVFHFDFYRLGCLDELIELGWDDYLDQSGIVVAEWADLFAEIMPDNALWIKIEHVEGGRTVRINR